MDEKKYLQEVFYELYEQMEARFSELEKKVYNQYNKRDNEDYIVYTSIVEKEFYDSTDPFMFPMCIDDVEVRTYNFDQIKGILLNDNVLEVCKVYLDMDRNSIKDIKWKNDYEGCVITKNGTYKAQFVIKQDDSYIRMIEDLKELFIRNKVQWVPVNAPYINKIFKVYIVCMDISIKSDYEIISVNVDFGLNAKYVKYNMIPLWNVSQKFIKTEGFIYPMEGKKVYEHRIKCKDSSLIGSKEYELISMIRQKNYTYVTCERDNSVVWDVKELMEYKKGRQDYDKYYKLMSNERKKTFFNGYARNLPYPIYTMEELRRIATAFSAGENILLKNVSNEGNIFRFSYSQVKDDYLVYDIIEFIMECMRLYLPNYVCIGELV